MKRRYILPLSAIGLLAPISLSAQSSISPPLGSILVTSPFGIRKHPLTGMLSFHGGVDLRAHHSLIYSILPGKIIRCGYQPLLGRFVRIAHGDTQSVYGHLSKVLVENGTLVEAGSIIGISGNSGRTTAEHLHFAVFYHHSPVHPLKFLFHLQAKLEK